MTPISFSNAVSMALVDLERFTNLPNWSKDLHLTYALARRHYLAGDNEALAEHIDQYQRSESAELWMVRLMELRLAIRMKKAYPEEKPSLQILKSVEDQGWRGEINMVLGMYYEELKNFKLASQCYAHSATAFASAGLTHKSLSAEYNGLIAQTLAFPQKRYLVAYHSFIQRSLAANHRDLAGVAMANFAREYQLLGLYEVALENSNRSLSLLKLASFGSLHYFLAVAQNLDLRLSLRRLDRCRLLFEELVSSAFSEIAEIIRVIERYQHPDSSNSKLNINNLPMPWIERLSPQSLPPHASDLENDLVAALTEGAKSLPELADHLYGRKIDAHSALARTKQAIYRLRKKVPSLIVLRKGRYELVD